MSYNVVISSDHVLLWHCIGGVLDCSALESFFSFPPVKGLFSYRCLGGSKCDTSEGKSCFC